MQADLHIRMLSLLERLQKQDTQLDHEIQGVIEELRALKAYYDWRDLQREGIRLVEKKHG